MRFWKKGSSESTEGNNKKTILGTKSNSCSAVIRLKRCQAAFVIKSVESIGTWYL